ncbi:MAG TPA: helix-turn-helix transcriptional regulator [Cellvibrio sp.]|nr:helix-turn-helix transcriptional regulator [Cellvibrio sp.]
MTLGDKLKQLRTDKNWTQPQAAEAIGIEQSYLSKLENDKSVPSAEIFSAVLTAFAVDAKQFLEGLNLAQLDRQFLQIPAIAAQINNHTKVRIHSIKKWLFSSAIAFVLGLTLISAGHLGLIFPNLQYPYFSEGIVKEGESKLIFDNWKSNFDLVPGFAYPPEEVANLRKILIAKKQEMDQRKAETYLLTNDYKGEVFVVAAEGGSRTYQLHELYRAGKTVSQTENRLLMLFGFLLTFSGITGFFVEHRLRKIN